jgi:hypothetical protein
MILKWLIINTNPTYLLLPKKVAFNKELYETTKAKGHKKHKRVSKKAKSRFKDRLAFKKAKSYAASVPPVLVVNIVNLVLLSSLVYIVDLKHLTTYLKHF